MRRYALAATVFLLCLGHQKAWSAEGELILGLGPMVSHGISSLSPDHGVGLLVDASYGLGEILSLRADAQWSHHPAAGSGQSTGITAATLGISSSLDVLVAVPYLHLGAGLISQSAPAAGSASNPELAAMLALGAQWRRWPGWALAAELRYHAVVGATTGVPSYFSFALKGQWFSEP